MRLVTSRLPPDPPFNGVFFPPLNKAYLYCCCVLCLFICMTGFQTWTFLPRRTSGDETARKGGSSPRLSTLHYSAAERASRRSFRQLRQITETVLMLFRASVPLEEAFSLSADTTAQHPAAQRSSRTGIFSLIGFLSGRKGANYSFLSLNVC